FVTRGPTGKAMNTIDDMLKPAAPTWAPEPTRRAVPLPADLVELVATPRRVQVMPRERPSNQRMLMGLVVPSVGAFIPAFVFGLAVAVALVEYEEGMIKFGVFVGLSIVAGLLTL